MAIRNIRVKGDEVLRKKCKPVEAIGKREMIILQDMADTMYKADGVGIAAPQVGILKRMFLVDIGDENGLMVFINPEILEVSGSQCGDEGCLSLPGKAGQVTRPNHVKAKFYDLDMNEWEVEGEGLMARCICHELDHLDGHMYTEKVEGGLHDVNYEEPEEE